MDLTIREATATDERAVTDLWRASGLTVPYNDPAADFTRALSGQASTVLVGERPRGAVIGTVMVGDDGHRGWIYYVAVAEGSRGNAVGRAMVAAGEDWLHRRGVAKVQLMIRPSNREVARFYEGLGYEETPRVVMARWIDGRSTRS